jgi:hypothetical protein
MCGRAQTSVSQCYTFEHLKRRGKQASESKVEIANNLYAEKHPQPPLKLAASNASEGSFRQPTEAEVSILTFENLRYARSHVPEFNNEFARLLNRGSELE